jgi:hypothetical protein
MPTTRMQFMVIVDRVTEQWILDKAKERGIKPAAFIREALTEQAEREGRKPNRDAIHYGRRPEPPETASDA